MFTNNGIITVLIFRNMLEVDQTTMLSESFPTKTWQFGNWIMCPDVISNNNVKSVCGKESVIHNFVAKL